MEKENIYLSTIASDAVRVAKEYSVNLEIAEYCTAWNMDEKFEGVDQVVQKKLDGISQSVLHAPFNELFPCAIDKKARELASNRYRQAIDLAKHYGSTKVTIHGGYNPWIYFPVWYVEQSVLFWKEFLETDPGVQIVLENVLETEPQWLLDIGHVNAYSEISVMEWLEACAPYISHFHVHNNDGTQDQHNALNNGRIPMKEFLLRAEALCPDATFTFELMKDEPSMAWLKENGLV